MENGNYFNNKEYHELNSFVYVIKLNRKEKMLAITQFSVNGVILSTFLVKPILLYFCSNTHIIFLTKKILHSFKFERTHKK